MTVLLLCLRGAFLCYPFSDLAQLDSSHRTRTLTSFAHSKTLHLQTVACQARYDTSSLPISDHFLALASRPLWPPRGRRSNRALTETAVGMAVATRVANMRVRTVVPTTAAKLISNAHGSTLEGFHFQRKRLYARGYRFVRKLGPRHWCARDLTLRALLGWHSRTT